MPKIACNLFQFLLTFILGVNDDGSTLVEPFLFAQNDYIVN